MRLEPPELGPQAPLGEEERRRSARIPLDVPVRLGKPKGAPYATVSARNLSARGLFIDADRPVRVGARFSVEIPYGAGEPVYVDEAEVAYNRKSAHGAGFGVRFTVLSEDAEERLEQIVERAVEPTMIVRRSATGEPLDEAPTLVSEPIELSEINLASYPEPAIVDENLELAEVLQSAPEVRVKGVKGVVQEVRQRFVGKVKSGPGLWAALMGIGGLALIGAVGVSLWSNARAEQRPLPAAAGARGVHASTHEVLMGEREPGSLLPEPAQAPAQDESVAPKRPLPPLVMLDEPEPQPEAQGSSEEERQALAKALIGPPERAPEPAPKAAKVPKVIKAPRPAPSPALAQAGAGEVSLMVEASARVLKTHVLRSPPRFVIDLVEQPKLPSPPPAHGHIKQVRVGRHPGKVRIVLDADRAIEAGRVSKEGTRLKVKLHYK